MLKIVNIVPVTRSNETQTDSEPDLAVNPLNTQQLAATAFTTNDDPHGNGRAPIYVSQDGGSTWELRNIIPDDTITGDVTIAFGPATGILFAAKIPPDSSGVLKVLRAANFLDPGEPPMVVLDQRTDADQPWVVAAENQSGFGLNTDRLYVSYNDSSTGGNRACVDSCPDADSVHPTFTVTPFDTQPQLGDAPQTRLAVHSSGTVYAAYCRYRSLLPPPPPPPPGEVQTWPDGSVITADVVVVRDDNWGTVGAGQAPFTVLGDNGAGVVVAGCINLIHRLQVGRQRTDGHLSIAVDPNNSDTVYLAWAEMLLMRPTPQGPKPLGAYVVHLQQSTDGGQTWCKDLLPLAPGLSFINAINPSVAVNDWGEVGLSYQLLTGTSPNDRWQTHIMISPAPGPQVPPGTTPKGFFPLDIVLADTPTVSDPTPNHNPLGDYDNLTAVGRTFFGIFSALNTPDKANFPHDVSYQRNADFGSHQLLDQAGTPSVSASVDPFFFQIAVPLRERRPGIRVPDFDGDGRTDLAVWRPSDGTWNVIASATGQSSVQQWGTLGDIPVPGDYDGDGTTDFAVWRPSNGTWNVIASSTGQSLPVQQWGTLGDIPVPGDYDGDGITDFAVWRPSDGTWNVIASSTGQPLPAQQWGMPGDVPVTGDYNGDGMTDLAVWRPSEVSWYVMASSTSAQLTQQLGMLSDIPL